MVTRTISVWQQLLSGNNNQIVAGISNNGETTLRALSSVDIDSKYPQIQIDQTGDALVIWISGNNRVTSSRYSKINNTWSDPVDISPNGATVDEMNPQLAMSPDGNAMAVWVYKTGNTKIIDAAIYTKATTSNGGWATKLTISDDDSDNTSPRVAIDSNGNSIVVWENLNNIKSKYYTRSNNTWSDIISLSTTGASQSPQIAMNINRAWAVWTTNNIVKASKYIGNGVWEQAVQLTDTDTSSTSPQIAIDPSNNAIAIWSLETGNPNTTIQAIYNNGTNWLMTDKKNISTNTGPNRSAKIVFNSSGNAIAIWCSSLADIYSNFFTKSTGWPSGWSNQISVGTGFSISDLIIDLDDSNNAAATWYSFMESGKAEIVTSYFTKTGNSWSTLPIISNPSLSSTNPQIVIDQSGTTTSTTSTTTRPTTTTTTTNRPGNLSITQQYVNNNTFPVTIPSDVTNITLVENIVATNNVQFIFPVGSNITFDGKNHTITLNSVRDYPGLISSGSDKTTVKNVGVLEGDSELGDDGGWIGAKEFRGTIEYCYSTCNIFGIKSGGIAGARAGSNGTCTIKNCYSNGWIVGSGGGIVGSKAGNGGVCTITNCYSTGIINGSGEDGSGCGGIAGEYAGEDGTCTITNCYSTGRIGLFSGLGAGGNGGIVGRNAGYNGKCTITGCYSTGDVYEEQSGGIAGYDAYSSCIIDKCYTTGAITGPGSGIIQPVGSRATVTQSGHTNGWIDSEAKQILTLSPDAYYKVSPSSITNIPYKLAVFVFNSYADLVANNLTYTSIWPIINRNVDNLNTYLVDSNGNKIYGGSVTLDSTNKILKLNNIPPISPILIYYSLVVSGEYIDRFVLVGNFLVRIRFNGDYFGILTSPELYKIFIDRIKESIATALGINIDRVNVLNLSPGSILAEIYIEPNLIPQLQTIVESDQLSFEYDGATYTADPNYFVVVDSICFHKDTLILTPNGYRKVQELQRGDLVKTAQGRVVPVKHLTSFVGSSKKCPLYVMYKDSISPNVPVQDLYMSGGHAFRTNGNWYHMKCSDLATMVDLDNIQYYNILLDNYLEHTLVANGVEVESLFEMDGLMMHWRCEEKCCKPIIEKVKQ